MEMGLCRRSICQYILVMQSNHIFFEKTGTEKLKKREQGRASKQEVEEICNKCADGTITPDNFHEYVRPTLYVDIKTKMERAWQYYDQDFQRKTEGTRDCVTIYAYGQSGTGKSTICRLYAKEPSTFPCRFSELVPSQSLR